MRLISGLRSFSVVLTSLGMAGAASAHDGHGNSPWHAFLHMIEENGLPLLLVFVLMVGMLVTRARRQRDRGAFSVSEKSKVSAQTEPGDSHDSR